MEFGNSEKKTCEGCNGACCKYVALEIDCPEDIDDFENVRWYVAHEDVKVYVDEDDEWNLEFKSKCKHIREDNKCAIHETNGEAGLRRPEICKSFNPDECSFHNEYKEKYTFESIEDVDKYIREIFEEGNHVVVEEEEEEEEGEENEEEYEGDEELEDENQSEATPEFKSRENSESQAQGI